MGDVRVRGSTVRAYLKLVDEDPAKAALLALLPPATMALFAAPPLPSSWVEWEPILHITAAMEKLGGPVAVRRLAGRAINEAKGPHIRILEGLLRLFGASPASIFGRFNHLVKNAMQNVEFIYMPTSERSGMMEVHYHANGEVPGYIFWGAVQVLTSVLQSCGKTGRVSDPQRLSPTAAVYRIEW